MQQKPKAGSGILYANSIPHPNTSKSNAPQWHWSKYLANCIPLGNITNLVVTAQYNAWCLNNGNHVTPKRGHLNWNSELIWKMRTELAFQWGLVEDEIPTLFEKLLQSIRACFLNLQSHLRGKWLMMPKSEQSGTNDQIVIRARLFFRPGPRN
jgi:hypothetical protein